MYSLESLNLIGNPVVNTCPEIARIDKSQDEVKAALMKYFGGSSSSVAGIPLVVDKTKQV